MVSWLLAGVLASIVTVATIVESHDEDGFDAQGFVYPVTPVPLIVRLGPYPNPAPDIVTVVVAPAGNWASLGGATPFT
jgi:hypothetical protein